LVKSFEDEILELIESKTEGGYWDFKRNWHAQKSDLLHDIICMANNLEDRDAYIIIGVDEQKDFSYFDLSTDKNRRGSVQIHTFLKEKKFAGGMRPNVQLKSIEIDNNIIDVIIIKNSQHTPYYLIEDFLDDKGNKQDNKRVRANHIYTRVTDNNTPKNENADLDKIEYLWRKRFGIHLPAIDRMKLYLSETDNWIYDDVRYKFYYKFDPLFVIQISDSSEEENSANSRLSFFFNKLFCNSENFHWEDYKLLYSDVVLFEGACSYNDSFSFLFAHPKSNLIQIEHRSFFKYFYYVKDDMRFLTDKIMNKFYNTIDTLTSKKNIKDCIIVFDSDEEQESFYKWIKINKEKIKKDEFEFPDSILQSYYEMDEHEGGEYLNAKKAKWLWENYYVLK